MASPGPEPPRPRRGVDRAIGIILGILLGVGIVTAFVFLGSEGTIDAPRIDDGSQAAGGKAGRGSERAGESRPKETQTGGKGVPVVRVIGGAPPPSGPPRLDFKQGGTVRFKIDTDVPIGIEIPGYGISETIDSDSTLSFRATRRGQFPVIVAASHISVASLRIRR